MEKTEAEGKQPWDLWNKDESLNISGQTTNCQQKHRYTFIYGHNIIILTYPSISHLGLFFFFSSLVLTYTVLLEVWFPEHCLVRGPAGCWCWSRWAAGLVATGARWLPDGSSPTLGTRVPWLLLVCPAVTVKWADFKCGIYLHCYSVFFTPTLNIFCHQAAFWSQLNIYYLCM